MEDTYRKLVGEFFGKRVSQFVPCAKYYPGMDFLIYLQDDDSYRAERVDSFITLLWHSSEDRIIGLKLKGWANAFQGLKSELGLTDDDFLPLTTALEFLVSEGLGEAIVDQTESARLRERKERLRAVSKYSEAIQFAKDIAIPPDEWVLPAAA